MSSCYSDDALRRLIDEDLDPGVFKAMELHIEACPRCAAGLERIGWVESGSGRVMASLLMNYHNQLPDVPGFEILEELGRGNWGLVYLARKTGQTRLNALKLMPQSAFPSDGPHDRRRWNREARAVSSVRHHNVVTLYDYGEVGRWFFLAFEYVPGGPLSRRLPPALPPRIAAELLEKTARAVEHIHANGLLHLDLKPSNILLDGPEGAGWDQLVPKVSDFGLSLSHEDMATPETSLNGPRGTPPYMAPEQTDEHRGKIGPATDVYALGAVLYELLTGRPPFRGQTVEILAMVRDQPPERPRHRNPGIPRDLETIVLKCLEKSPSRRYPTAAALADELTRWLDGRPILARPVPLAERGARLCRRNPVVASLCLTLVLTAAAAFGVVLHSLQREHAARQAAEQNSRVVSAVALEFGGILLHRYYGHSPLRGDALKRATALLREQLANADANGSRHPELLRMMSEIDGQVASRLKADGRLAEARALVVERLELARKAHESAPSSLNCRAYLAEALIQSGDFAVDDHRLDRALVDYDQASKLLLGHPGTVPNQPVFHTSWLSLCLSLSDAYHRLPPSTDRDEHQNGWERAIDAHVDKAIRTGAVDASLPAATLFRACLLADRDQWSAARDLLRGTDLSTSDEAGRRMWSLADREVVLDAWAVRAMRQWAAEEERRSASSVAIMTDADQFDALLGTLKIAGKPVQRVCFRVIERLATLTKRHRDAGRLDRADQEARFFRLVADRLIQEFPEDPNPHRFLSEALIQESKNAWRRDDIATVRKSLKSSISSLRRLLELDPEDENVRANLIDQSRRLAALPPP